MFGRSNTDARHAQAVPVIIRNPTDTFANAGDLTFRAYFSDGTADSACKDDLEDIAPGGQSAATVYFEIAADVDGPNKFVVQVALFRLDRATMTESEVGRDAVENARDAN